MEHPEKKKERKPRSRRFAILMTAAVLCLAALVYFVGLPIIKRAFPAATPSIVVEHTQRRLAAVEKDELQRIDVSHQWDGESYSLIYENGLLRLTGQGEESIAINEAYQADILSVVSEIVVQDTIVEDAQEVKDNLKDMGLDPALISVTVTRTNGKQYVLSFGGQAPESADHYYRYSEDKGVYLCDVGSYEAFEVTANMLLPVEQPVFVKGLIDYIRVSRPEMEMELAFSTDLAGCASAQLISPARYPVSAEKSEAILTALGSLRLGTFQAELTDQNKASFGLEVPQMTLTIHQQAGLASSVDSLGQLAVGELTEREYLLTVGAAQGNYFYYVGYQGNCYYVSRFLLSALLEATPEQLSTRTPADLGDAALNTILIQKGETLLDIRISRTERVEANNELVKDDQGNIVYDVSATKNGEPMTTGALDALIERLKNMTVSGNLPADYTLGTDAPRWQITLTTAGGVTRTIVAHPMDAMSDALTVDGVTRHYINSEAILIAIGDL